MSEWFWLFMALMSLIFTVCVLFTDFAWLALVGAYCVYEYVSIANEV